tara:strand:+ start:15 stop:1160 length:1146 start_codon:yes stop_codon:yes gene_type:complete
MFRVNRLLIGKILFRSLIAAILCMIVIYITGRIADVEDFVGINDTVAIGSRTILTKLIFRFVPFYGQLFLSILSLILISSTILIVSINKYISKGNSIDFNLLIYLPCLLIYASTPTKEFLFFIPALLYIIIECEHLLKDNRKKSKKLIDRLIYNGIIYLIKISILIFMLNIRGPLAYPYLLLAIIVFIFKTFNLNIIRINKLNFSVLIIYSLIISLFLIFITDKDLILSNLNNLNKNFLTDSALSREYNTSIFNNIYNPFTFFKIQLLSLFPTIEETLSKPYAILILYESIIIIYLFFKYWSKLFVLVGNDNRAKSLFLMIFILIACSYFLLYGFLGYSNLGSAQRFRTNFIPISIILPLVAENIISKHKLKNNFIHKKSF